MTAMILRLGLSGWRRRWLGTLLTFMLITVAAGAVMLSLQLRDVAQRPWQDTFDVTNGAHLLAFGQSRDVEALGELDGVSQAAGPMPIVVTSMTVRSSTFGLRAIGVDEPPAVERPVVREGRWLSGDGELVLERSFARAIGVQVGDTVELKTVNGSLIADIVGVSVLASDAPYPDNQPGEGYLRRGDINRIQPDENRLSWIEAVRVGDVSDVSAIARQAFEVLPREVFVRTFEDRLADASERHHTTTIVLRTFAFTLLLAVGLVLATLISVRVLDRAAELGLLKAVGLTPALITLVVAVEVLVLAAAAAVAGAFLGSWITPLIVRRSSELLGTVPVAVSTSRVVLTVVTVVSVVGVAAVVPTLRLARAGVLRLLSARVDAGTINRVARRLPLRSPLPATLAAKQTLARPARSAATAAALALTVASLVAGLAFEATVKHEDAVEQQAQQNRPRDPNAEGLAPSQPDPVPISDSTREQLRPIVHSFNGVLVAVAVMNLLATAIVSLRRRRRDIAVTRAIGLTPAQVQRSVFCADGLVGLAAALLGIPLGIAMFLGVYQLVNGDTELAVLPPIWQLIAVPVTCVAAVIAVVAVPARSAVRVTLIDALRYE